MEAKSAVDEKLSFGNNLVYALQHVFVMVAGAVAVPIMVGNAAGLDHDGIRFLVSCALLAAGIATVLQTYGVKEFLGARIPIIEGTSFAAVSTICAFVAASALNGNGIMGLREIAGGVMVAGLFCFATAGVFGKLLRFFPKVVTGTVVCIIGFSLFPVGIRWVATVNNVPKPTAPIENILLALATLALILIFNKFLKGILGNLSILFGLLAGTVLGSAVGMANFDAVKSAPWFSVVTPMHFGAPVFKLDVIIGILVIMLVIMTEAMGNIIAVHNISGKPMHDANLTRGLRSSGLSTIISSLLNSYPVTPFAQNVGMVSLTGVYSRFVTFTAGLILILLGFFPKFAAIFTSIPKPVLGGAGFAMFGVVAVGGIRTLGQVNYNGNKNVIIVAVSLGLSLIPTAVPDFFNAMPASLAKLLHSGITIGCVSAILLNIFFNIFLVPEDKREKVEH